MASPTPTASSLFASIEAAAGSMSGKPTEDGRLYGHRGALTNEQDICLRRMWEGLLAFFDDDKAKLNELGLTSAFADIKIKSTDDNQTSETATPVVAEPVPQDETAKKKGGFWGGLSNGISSIASSATRSRPTTPSGRATPGESANADTGGDGIICTSTRPVTLEELRVGFWGLIMHDHPDSLLLRFLRARKWVVVKALEGAVLTLQWRVRENLAEIVREGEAKLNLRTLQIGQAYMHGVDKQQRPVCYIAARHHNKDLQPFEDIRRFTLWTMETVRLMIHPPVETVDILFDLGDFTMANMDYNFVKFIVQCFQAYYPESLGVYVVANAPWVFWGIWKIITPLLDPVVASKFQCARKVNDLQEYIDPSWLLPSLGGTDERGFTYLPYRKEDDYRLNDEAGRAEHQAALDALNTRFVAQTRDWIAAGENAAALETASKERDGTADEMRTAFFKLDPYVRSRTFYHRLGVLGEDGSCDWSRLRTAAEYKDEMAGTDASGKAASSKTVSAPVSNDDKLEEVPATAAITETKTTVIAHLTENVSEIVITEEKTVSGDAV